ADRPAVLAVRRLRPPAVGHGDVERAVRRGLHARRPARLLAPPREGEPHVDPLDEGPREREPVVLHEEDLPGARSLAGGARDGAQDRLPRGVGGWSLARDEEPHRSRGGAEETREPLGVAKEKLRALVRGEAPREPDEERLLVERAAEPVVRLGGEPPLRE